MAYQTNQGELDRIRGAGAQVLPGLQRHFILRTADNVGIMRRIRQLQ